MVATAVLVALSVSACAGKRKKPTLAYEERPVELLYSTGADRLDRGSWNEAVDYFREVERQHPYSEWSRRSILMTGYAHYMGNQYNEAISDADRFIGLYPGNPSASYAYYLKAVCYFEQIVDVNRDQAATEQALAALRDVVQRYPNSEYAQDARLKIDMVNDQLAGKEMTIGRYYLRNGQTLAAIGRFRTVVDRHQTTSHTPEALYRLVESYLTLGLLDEAKRNGAVLGYNFPGDPWYAEAYKLLTNNGLQAGRRAAEGRQQEEHAGPPDPRQGHHPGAAGTSRRPSPRRAASRASWGCRRVSSGPVLQDRPVFRSRTFRARTS
jgi:outer membrane protein assembly factor BamD